MAMLLFPMGMLRRLACSLLAVLASGVAAAAAAAPPLRVGTSGDYAPFSVRTPGDPPAYEGFDIAVARAFAADRGVQVEWVPFRWPTLRDDLSARRFDIAMSGVTVRPGRSVAGRFSVPVAESGAVVLVGDPDQWKELDALDQRRVRIAVNAGGHLEQVTRGRFTRATLIFVPENDAVLRALVSGAVDAAVTDTLEARFWRAQQPELGLLGPFTRDRKAYLVRADRADLAAEFDAWLMAREQDGSLEKVRQGYFGSTAGPLATPLGALFAAMDERLALMPWVGKVKRENARPIEDPGREARVLAASAAAVAAAAGRLGVEAPDEAAVQGLFRAQIEAAKEVQMGALRDPEFQAPEPLPDLDLELRPALLRIGEHIAALLLQLPAGLEPDQVEAAARSGLRSPWLSEASRNALARAVVAVAQPARARDGDGAAATPDRP